MPTAFQHDICAEIPDLLLCDEDEMFIFLSRQNERQLTRGCLARGLSSDVLNCDKELHFNDCLIMVCKKKFYREFIVGKIENAAILRSLSSEVKLFVRTTSKTDRMGNPVAKILKFWFRILMTKERERNVAVTFLGCHSGELLCSGLFSLPLQNPQDTFFSRRFGQKIRYTLRWILFVFSIRSALVTLKNDNNC